MKHCDFSKFLILLISCLFMASCVNREEIEFSGTVVGIRNCHASYLDQNAGYMVQLDTPEGVGGTVTGSDGTEMTDIIVLYEPPKHIMVEDHIHGTFYRDDKYSKANCDVHYNDLPLPEGVILEVHVD